MDLNSKLRGMGLVPLAPCWTPSCLFTLFSIFPALPAYSVAIAALEYWRQALLTHRNRMYVTPWPGV